MRGQDAARRVDGLRDHRWIHLAVWEGALANEDFANGDAGVALEVEETGMALFAQRLCLGRKIARYENRRGIAGAGARSQAKRFRAKRSAVLLLHSRRHL